MSEYDLRSLCPLNGQALVANGEKWLCRLAEVSDLRPEQDRLSWYLIFQVPPDAESAPTRLRKLEIVTPAEQTVAQGWSQAATEGVLSWLKTEDQDGRLEIPDR